MLVVLYAVIREKGKGVRTMYGMFFFLMCFWVVIRAGKNLDFFGIFYRFLGFLGFLKVFFRFLGFNVHNTEHRYIIYDPRQVTYMKICLLVHYLYSVLNCPI